MNQSTHNAFLFQASVEVKPQLHAAVLLSPAEVDVAFKDEPDRARELVIGHWMLTGVVNHSLFTAMRVDAGKDIAGELGIISTSTGAAYLILCSELGVRHHRHVLPLYEPKVKEFLSHATQEPFRLFIESASDCCERMLYTSPLEPGLFVAARDACGEMNVNKRANFIDELPLLIAHVSKLETMRALKSQRIREVDVSILLPYEATAGSFPMVRFADQGSAYRH